MVCAGAEAKKVMKRGGSAQNVRERLNAELFG